MSIRPLRLQTKMELTQVGVTIVKGSVQTVRVTSPAQWNLPDDDAPTLTGVTTLRRAPGIDVFVVNSLCIGGSNFASGVTAFHNRWGIGDRETGVIVARRRVAPSTGLESPSNMARTLAHEIGHLIHNEARHDPRSWNLMRAGEVGSTSNSDLTINYRDAIGIGPGTYDNDENW